MSVDTLAMLVEVAVAPAVKPPNLWGALGCALAYSAALFATLDAFADLVLERGSSGTGRFSPGLGLKFGSKIAAAVIAVVSAAIVLALDANWFAFTWLSIAFLGVVGIAVLVLLWQARRDAAAVADTPRHAVQDG